MPTNLTGNTIASTYDQILHVDDGPTATAKTVYSGTGVATALKVATTHIEVDNVKVDGNTISTLDTNGNLVLAPNGTGSVAMAKVAVTGGTISGITDLAVLDGGTGASTASDARTNLGLGTMATQAANSVAITGGAITGITDLAIADGGTGSSTAPNARTALGLGTIATQGAGAVAISGGSVDNVTMTSPTLTTPVINTHVKITALLVGGLTAPATAGAGSRATVSDATQTLTAGIGAIVAGGGANIVPVFSNGTNWLIG